MKNNKKSQAASAAATLIAIIAGLIVLYILFLPPADREELLEGEDADDDDDVAEENISIILSEAPKRLFPLTEAEFEQEFPTVIIYVGEEGIELKKVDTIYISKSLFKEKKDNVTFEILDLANTKDILLNFEINKAEERLIIKLNGHEIYNAEVETSIEPIELKEYLKQGINVLEFSVSSPGASFWATNEYSLEKILITAEVIRRETQESELTFVIDPTERDNLKKVKLHFYASCKLLDVGKLDILINNYKLYSAVPDCGSAQRPIEFAPERLVTGENRIIFATDKGRYLIDNIKLSSELKKITAPIYYFELNQTQMDQIDNNTLDASLYMRFADDTTDKEADIFVNNHAIRLDQTDIEFEEEIDNYVEEGNNAIKIEPEEILDIVELKVVLEED